MIGSKIIVPKTIDPTAQRALEDRQLLDRLMPEIIKRIDVKLVLTQRPGQIGLVKPSTPIFAEGRAVEAKARCQPGETTVSVGFGAQGGDGRVYYVKRDNPNDRNSDRPAIKSDTNAWTIRSYHDGEGELRTYAECLKVQLSLRPVSAHAQQPLGYLQEIPSQPRPPTQPPGGPPLQPPPEIGRK